MRALVVESGHSRAALAAVRGLAAAGWDVGIAVPERDFASASRHAGRFHRIPALHAGVDLFADAVEHVIRRHGYDVILPAGDAEALTVSLVRDRLSANVPLPVHSTLLTAMDKLELTRAAQNAGISTPATWGPQDPEPPRIHGRIIVKPRLHWEPGASVPRRPSSVPGDIHSGRDTIGLIEASGGAAMLQEFVEGRLVAWIGLIDGDGELVAVVQQEAYRLHPPGDGVTARGATVRESPEMTAKAMRLLRGFGWFGLAQLQFLVAHDGEPKLVDLNARCYGSMSLAIAAGINFPALWAAIATKRPVGPSRAAVGTRYQWLEGDLRSAWTAHRRGRAKALVDVARWGWRANHSVWKLDDPLPGAAYALQLTGRMARGSGREGLVTTEPR